MQQYIAIALRYAQPAAASLLAALKAPLPFFAPLSVAEGIVLLQLALWLAAPALRALAARLPLGRSYVVAGEWAIVTGGSDGIGKAYADALLRKGMHVLLVARSEDNLKQAAAELQAAADAGAKRSGGARPSVDYHVADFASVDIYPAIAASAWRRPRARAPRWPRRTRADCSHPSPRAPQRSPSSSSPCRC